MFIDIDIHTHVRTLVFSKPDPKSEYSLSNGYARAVLDVPQWTSLARVVERSRG